LRSVPIFFKVTYNLYLDINYIIKVTRYYNLYLVKLFNTNYIEIHLVNNLREGVELTWIEIIYYTSTYDIKSKDLEERASEEFLGG